MLTRRLIMAAFAALFAASTSLAILQPQPAMAAPDGQWRAGHHARHDRDDRWKRRHPHHAKYHHRKPHRDPRDRR